MRLVLLGDPVEHSLSPIIHAAALRHTGVKGTYEARRVDERGMRVAVDEARGGTLDGANVTMPHKRLAFELADRNSPEAEKTRAVNTLVRVGEEVVGHNTDVAGVRNAWRWAGLSEDAPIALYGAGGAAAAVLYVSSDRTVSVAARRPGAAEALIDMLGTGNAVPWGPPAPGSVFVNATPIGMHGERFQAGWLDGVAGVFDMAYGEQPTPAVETARAAGLPVADGQDMLLGQAVDAFWLWTGRRAPVEAMRTALAARR